LMLVEWGVSFVAPGPASILFYAHYGCLGALLISGFWQLMNERFDPRTAKRQLGGLTAAATVGGLLGGLVAFHFICAAAIARAASTSHSIAAVHGSETPAPGKIERLNAHAVAKSPYIRGLIILVLLATISEGLIDLVLKGRASMAMVEQGHLLRFFAYFYTAASLVTVVVQAGL